MISMGQKTAALKWQSCLGSGGIFLSFTQRDITRLCKAVSTDSSSALLFLRSPYFTAGPSLYFFWRTPRMMYSARVLISNTGSPVASATAAE